MNLLLQAILLASLLNIITQLRTQGGGVGYVAAAPDEDNSCRILINEINTANPSDIDKKQFIEFFEYCSKARKGRPPSNKLIGHKIAIIRGHKPAIVGVIDLFHSNLVSTPNGRFFTVGSVGVDNVDLLLSGPQVKLVEENGVLPVGDDSPYAILPIQHKTVSNLKPIDLYLDPNTKKWLPTIITPALKEVLLLTVKDMFVYGRKAEANRCDIFEELWPDLLKDDRLYMLRDWDTDELRDLSLNRCSPEVAPFRPAGFKFGLPTPGRPNNCYGVSVFLEDVIDDVAPLVPSTASEQDLSEDCLSEIPEIPNKRYKGVDGTRFSTFVHNKAQETSGNEIDDEAFGSDEAEVQLLDSIISPIEKPLLPDYLDTSKFKPEWVARMNEETFDRQILSSKNVQEWWRLNEENGNYFCGICVDFFNEGNRADVRLKKNIQTPDGTYSTTKSRNTYEVLHHPKNPVHQAATKHQHSVARLKAEGQFAQAKAAYDSTDQGYYLPTGNMMLAVYAEALANIPFSQHGLIISLLREFKTDVGTHHANKGSASEMLSVISKTMHEILLKNLIESDVEFSLIVDGSTDKLNVAYLTVLIQTLEDGFPIIYFYRLIELKYGESAKGMFRSLREAIEEDSSPDMDFSKYFKKRMTLFMADGASNMQGKHESLSTEIRSYIGREIPNLHCLAHRLSLLVKRALNPDATKDERFAYFAKFEKGTNELYNFYMSRGSKRFASLVQVALDLDLALIRIKKWFEIRWATSHYEVLRAIKVNYVAVMNDLLVIQADMSFNKAARDKASEIYDHLADKNYVLLLHGFLDILERFSILSKSLQQQAGLLVDKYGYIDRIKKDLLALKSEYGNYVKIFLGTIICNGVCDGETTLCTVAQYEACENVKYNHITLSDLDSTSPKLSEIYGPVIDRLLNEVDSYFPPDTLNAFEIFDPKNLRIGRNEVEAGMKYICAFYADISHHECTEITASYYSVLVQIVLNTANYEQTKNSGAEKFWPLMLKNADLPWTPQLVSLIRRFLVTPFGTADAERSFYYMTKIKSDNRKLLESTSLDFLLRVVINGSDKLNEFRKVDYARKWLVNHYRTDDPNNLGGRPVKSDKPMKKFRRSKLF